MTPSLGSSICCGCSSKKQKEREKETKRERRKEGRKEGRKGRKEGREGGREKGRKERKGKGKKGKFLDISQTYGIQNFGAKPQKSVFEQAFHVILMHNDI